MKDIENNISCVDGFCLVLSCLVSGYADSVGNYVVSGFSSSLLPLLQSIRLCDYLAYFTLARGFVFELSRAVGSSR